MPFEKVTPPGTQHLVEGYAWDSRDSTPIPADRAVEIEAPRVEVYWTRDQSGGDTRSPGSVHLGVQIDTNQIRELVKYADKYGGITSVWVMSEDLGRTDINHLIRTVRRARNAAFGADE